MLVILLFYIILDYFSSQALKAPAMGQVFLISTLLSIHQERMWPEKISFSGQIHCQLDYMQLEIQSEGKPLLHVLPTVSSSYMSGIPDLHTFIITSGENDAASYITFSGSITCQIDQCQRNRVMVGLNYMLYKLLSSSYRPGFRYVRRECDHRRLPSQV